MPHRWQTNRACSTMPAQFIHEWWNILTIWLVLVVSHVRMSHVTHMTDTQSRLDKTYSIHQRMMDYSYNLVSISNVAHANESRRIDDRQTEPTWQDRHNVFKYKWVMSHTWMSHVTLTNESRHTYERVTSHVWMSIVTHTNESRYTYE